MPRYLITVRGNYCETVSHPWEDTFEICADDEDEANDEALEKAYSEVEDLSGDDEADLWVDDCEWLGESYNRLAQPVNPCGSGYNRFAGNAPAVMYQPSTTRVGYRPLVARRLPC